MEFKLNVPMFEEKKSFLFKSSTIGLIYFLIAYLGTFVTPYIDVIPFFDLPSIAFAGAISIRYKWAGIFGSIIGSLFFHLLDMPLLLAFTLATATGTAAYLFCYFFKLFYPKKIVINEVSIVAVFAFIAAPIASIAHTIISIVSMQALGFTNWDSMMQSMLSWWFTELLIAYLTVPLILSILSYQKIYFSMRKKIEMGSTFFLMIITSWLTVKYSNTNIIISNEPNI